MGSTGTDLCHPHRTFVDSLAHVFSLCVSQSSASRHSAGAPGVPDDREDVRRRNP